MDVEQTIDRLPVDPGAGRVDPPHDDVVEQVEVAAQAFIIGHPVERQEVGPFHEPDDLQPGAGVRFLDGRPQRAFPAAGVADTVAGIGVPAVVHHRHVDRLHAAPLMAAEPAGAAAIIDARHAARRRPFVAGERRAGRRRPDLAGAGAVADLVAAAVQTIVTGRVGQTEAALDPLWALHAGVVVPHDAQAAIVLGPRDVDEHLSQRRGRPVDGRVVELVRFDADGGRGELGHSVGAQHVEERHPAAAHQRLGEGHRHAVGGELQIDHVPRRRTAALGEARTAETDGHYRQKHDPGYEGSLSGSSLATHRSPTAFHPCPLEIMMFNHHPHRPSGSPRRAAAEVAGFRVRRFKASPQGHQNH
jgi:hypothetical protein